MIRCRPQGRGEHGPPVNDSSPRAVNWSALYASQAARSVYFIYLVDLGSGYCDWSVGADYRVVDHEWV